MSDGGILFQSISGQDTVKSFKLGGRKLRPSNQTKKD